MRSIALAAILASLTALASCGQSGGSAVGGAAPAPGAGAQTGAQSGSQSSGQPETQPGGSAGAAMTGVATPAPPLPADVDWSTVAPATERHARNALYGIIRQMDLNRFEDTGWDILSFSPGAGPQDSQAFTYSPVTVFGETFEVDESAWLGLFNLVEAWEATHPQGFMARPMPDARYGDGERSERGDLLFALVVEDRDEKTLKIVWSRQ